MENVYKKKISAIRTSELTKIAQENKFYLDKIRCGLDKEEIDRYNSNKQLILEYFNATQDDWNNYEWQLSHKIDDVQTLYIILELSEEEKQSIENIGKKYRWAISPYYASLMEKGEKLDPIKLLSVPTHLEDSGFGESDPMKEEFTNPAGSITRRYPDRLIINVTNVCASYCRHCQRKRRIGEIDKHCSKQMIDESIEYVRQHNEIRDVLVTGGDALCLNDLELEYIIKALREIPHVEIIRLGTKTLANLPQRITDDLVNMLKKYHPIYINIQFNHPREITPECKESCEKLANAGVVLGNQAVFYLMVLTMINTQCAS